ncbi:MAG: hypothetical protein WC445_04930 [Patescibacteria group bacterium]
MKNLTPQKKETPAEERREREDQKNFFFSFLKSRMSDEDFRKKTINVFLNLFFLMILALLLDKVLKAHVFLRPWFFKLIACSALLLFFNILEDKKFKIHNAVRILTVLLIVVSIWFSQDRVDLVRWVLGKSTFSSAPQPSKQRETVLERTLIGKGYQDDGAVFAAKFGAEIKPGYKVSLVSENGEKFDVSWNGNWVTKNGAFEFISECQENSDFFIVAKDSLKVVLKIQKSVQLPKQEHLVASNN